MYDKGIETKKTIFTLSKKLFYELGYQKTTMRLIAKEANIPIGLISYYFKSKENIIYEIYADYIKNIFAVIDEATNGNINSILLRQIVGLRIYYQNILGNKQASKFNYELTIKQSNYTILFNDVKKTYLKILDEFNVYISKEECDAYIIAEFGARQELLLSYYRGEMELSIQDLVSIIASIAPRLFQIDYNIINSHLFKSLSIYKGLDINKVNDVKFLL